MYWHPRIYKEAQTVSRAATTKFDIPVNVPIGTILLKLTCGRVNTGMYDTEKWRLVDYLDDVALIGDGKTILKSLPGIVYQAQAYYDQGGPLPSQVREYNVDSDRLYLPINLGRRYHDDEMYLTPGKFDSLELQIAFAGTSADWNADAKLDIILEQPSGAGVPASKGYIKSEVWREWATVSDEWKYFILPTGYKYRRIFLQAIPETSGGIEETSMFNLMNEIRLAYKNGDIEVYHNGLEYLAKMDVLEHGGPFRAYGWNMHTADVGFRTGLGYMFCVVTSSGSKDGAVVPAVPTVEADMGLGVLKWENFDTETEMGYLVLGACPEYCVPFKFDRNDDPATWLDPVAMGDVLLDIHTRLEDGTYAGGTNRLIFDRWVP